MFVCSPKRSNEYRKGATKLHGDLGGERADVCMGRRGCNCGQEEEEIEEYGGS